MLAKQSPTVTAILSRVPSVGDLLAQPGLTNAAVQTALSSKPSATGPSLSQSVSLTGSPNSPATPQGANVPGLNGSGGNEEMKSHHWLWIAIIVLVLLGVFYFYSNSSAAST
jgi:hypothetical protein